MHFETCKRLIGLVVPLAADLGKSERFRDGDKREKTSLHPPPSAEYSATRFRMIVRRARQGVKHQHRGVTG